MPCFSGIWKNNKLLKDYLFIARQLMLKSLQSSPSGHDRHTSISIRLVISSDSGIMDGADDTAILTRPRHSRARKINIADYLHWYCFSVRPQWGLMRASLLLLRDDFSSPENGYGDDFCRVVSQRYLPFSGASLGRVDAGCWPFSAWGRRIL